MMKSCLVQMVHALMVINTAKGLPIIIGVTMLPACVEIQKIMVCVIIQAAESEYTSHMQYECYREL